MRKGITPIISIIILLLITVALAGAAYSFLQGLFTPQISKSFLIPTGGAYCSSGKIIVYVVNTGYQSTMTGADFNLIAIDGNLIPSDGAFSPIQTGQSGKILDFTCSTGQDSLGATAACGSNCCDIGPGDYSGHHIIDMGTVSSVQHLSVFCS